MLRKKKKNKNENIASQHAKKKKVVAPAATEKMCLVRKKIKTKTKKKELYVIGDYVRLNSDKWGIIRYKGSCTNVTGIWFGIELLGIDKDGECDGMFNDERYFKCDANAGLFVMYQAIECRMKQKDVDKLSNKSLSKKGNKRKGKKRRSNTMAMAQSISVTLTKQMITSMTPNKQTRITATNPVKQKKDKKDKKNGKNKVKKKGRSKTNAQPPKALLVPPQKKSISTTPKGDSNGTKFKFVCPSERKMNISQTPQLNSIQQQQQDEPPMLSLNVIDSDVDSASPRSNTSDTSDTSITRSIGSSSGDFARFAAATTPKGTTPKAHLKSMSNNNLDNILRRGRKLNKKNNDSNHKRTRSWSANKNDNSWMTQNSINESQDRIKENIMQQKQLDLQSLMNSGSFKKKKDIGKLFEKHIERAKVTSSKGGNEPNTSGLKEQLKDEVMALENAVNIVKDLGFFKYIKDNEIYSKIYIKKRPNSHINNNDDDEKKGDGDGDAMDYDLFDMNNIDILSKFQGKTRDILSKVICKAIVTLPNIEIVEICNCDLDADFMVIFVDYLQRYYIEKGTEARISILSLQSNPIIDRGMIELCKLIRLNHKILTTIKLQNNRRDISTLICQQICESLQENEYIIKFEFKFRHYQWRDYRDKVIKRNSEKARLMRLEMQKNISI